MAILNLEVLQQNMATCLNLPQGSDMSTYINTCIFIYDQDPVNGIIKIDDQSEQVAFYDPATDVHEVFVTVLDQRGVTCYTESIDPFGNLSFTLPEEGCYTIEVDIRYTIQWDDGFGNITPHTFQDVWIFPVEWSRSGDYHNSLMYDIKCRIAKLGCEIIKRRKVGRAWNDLQERIYALNNYLYAICNFCLSVEEFDKIVCKVRTIKKVC